MSLEATISLHAKTVNENIRLKKRVKELEQAINSALKIKDLWLPGQGELISEEHAGEAQALAMMYSKFKALTTQEIKTDDRA